MSEEIWGFNRQMNVKCLYDQIKIFPFTNCGNLYKSLNISEPQSPHLLNREKLFHEVAVGGGLNKIK